MPSNIELFEHFRYLDWLIFKYNQCLITDEKDHFDVSRGQGRVLTSLIFNDSVSTRDLSKQTGINISSLNEILAKLEKKELVKRIPYPKDKRIIINCITEKARNFRPQLNLSCFDCLSEKEREQFNDLIKKLSIQVEKDISQLGNEEMRSCYRNRKNSFILFLDKIKEKELSETC